MPLHSQALSEEVLERYASLFAQSGDVQVRLYIALIAEAEVQDALAGLKMEGFIDHSHVTRNGKLQPFITVNLRGTVMDEPGAKTHFVTIVDPLITGFKIVG